MIEHLYPGEIFVFGSNLSGLHGAGAAKMAKERFGAEGGIYYGMTGKCFAIPTRRIFKWKPQIELETLPIETIEYYIDAFVGYASKTPDKKFLLTEVGCGHAGYTPEQIAPLFKGAIGLINVVFPDSFKKILQIK